MRQLTTLRILRHNNSGFTLVELMVATLITIVGLLGLLTAVEYATFQNVQTQMRDEMAQVAEAQMSTFRAMPFTLISTSCSSPPCGTTLYSYSPISVPSKLRGINKSYTVIKSTVVTTDKTAVDLGVRVRSWVYKNTSTAIEVHTVKGQ